MYQLYIAHKNYSSWSLRPWILMKELGISFDEHVYFFQDDNWDTFRGFSPTGKVPSLKMDDITVWDSLAIVEFLAERHPQVWPDNPVARAWARCAASEMHAGFLTLRNVCPMNCSIQVQLYEVSPALQKDITRIDELLGEGLRHFGGPFLTGANYTAVDAFFAPVLIRIHGYGLELSEPVMAYAAHMLHREAMQEWIKAGQHEPRHELYEASCFQHGKLIHDAREG